MQRLGRKHWSDPTLEGASIWKDEEFKQLEPSRIVDETERSLVPLDDLAVVVLFSVFEAVVRNHLLTRIQPEAQRLVDPVLKTAAEDAIQGVREGSFFLRVLDPLGSQGQVPPDLITQVNQVRGYRNWAAHGRRDSPANVITPLVAYERLRAFLLALGIPDTSDQPVSDSDTQPLGEREEGGAGQGG